ncbi:MAG: ABC transporter ATP-binding protein [Methanobacteriaceae archaeon]|nr:ABC transporter ATP-binding protein [Methanobacteriaceae archaeon]
MTMTSIIKINNLKKSYENSTITALNNLNLEIEDGDFVSIIGPSGCGKSTLLNMIGALDIPDSGSVTVDGKLVSESKKLNKFRAEKIGFIFQLHNLLPNISVIENIEIPLYGQNIKKEDMRKKSLKLLEEVQLSNKADILPTKLSGGERQRVAICRSLVNNPKIILADEPTGALDSKNSKLVMDLLKKLHKEKNVTLIVVTHDLDIAKEANRTIKMLDGKVIN